MGFWNDIVGGTSKYTKNAMSGAEQATEAQKALNKQYTGNAGYQNSIDQGLKGAAVTANQSGAQAANAGRNAGMTKAQAAAMGGSNAANAYGQNFANQQNVATNLGNQAIQANALNANQYSQLANLGLSERNQANEQANRFLGNIVGLGSSIGSNVLNPIIGLSDENCKNITDEANHISELVESIQPYIYKYTDEAQDTYPNETDDKERVGLLAQDLEKNPITAGSVMEDKNGIKHVNGAQLAMEAIALISDMSKRISEIEENK